MILPATLKRGALVAAEKIRLKMEETKIQGESKLPSKNLTVSIGAACVPTDANTTTDLIRQADSALYKAKRMGKNRVEACSEERRSFRRRDTALLGQSAASRRQDAALYDFQRQSRWSPHQYKRELGGGERRPGRARFRTQ